MQRIIEKYGLKNQNIHEYMERFNVSRPTASRNLAKLVKLGFIKTNYNGKFNEFYTEKMNEN